MRGTSSIWIASEPNARQRLAASGEATTTCKSSSRYIAAGLVCNQRLLDSNENTPNICITSIYLVLLLQLRRSTIPMVVTTTVPPAAAAAAAAMMRLPESSSSSSCSSRGRTRGWASMWERETNEWVQPMQFLSSLVPYIYAWYACMHISHYIWWMDM